MELAELRAWLRLSRLELSPKRAGMLLERFGDACSIFAASEHDLLSTGIGEKAAQRILSPEPPGVEQDLVRLEELGVTLLAIRDPGYPAALKEIYDPPPVLFVRGALIEPDRFSVAIVGSRRASNYGRAMAERIAADLASRGLTVVSGGARGVDSAAHRGALDAGGRTVCVLGCGVDFAYPPENKALFERIAEGGALVSEFPLGATPEPWRFPVRNRIISGIALGVLVCQAPVDSGALITARTAAEQGRDVYALPGNVDDQRNTGCHRLIRDGAVLVESAQDILQELGISVPDEHKPQLSLDLSFNTLSPDERRLIELLSLQPKHVDQIIQETSLPAPQVTSALTLLEMKGLVRRVPGSAYVRAV